MVHWNCNRYSSGWHLISNINQNSIWLTFDIKHQPKLYLVDIWYQTSTKTLSGWCLISIINRVTAGWQLIFIYSNYVFSLHFNLCRFQKRYTILTLFLLNFVIFRLYKKTFFIKLQPELYLVNVNQNLSGWCLISKVNQNCIWLMFDIKCQPELYLVDVWYQTSTRTVSGWCLLSIVKHQTPTVLQCRDTTKVFEEFASFKHNMTDYPVVIIRT